MYHCYPHLPLIKAASQDFFKIPQLLPNNQTCPVNHLDLGYVKATDCCYEEDIPKLMMSEVLGPSGQLVMLPLVCTKFFDIVSFQVRKQLEKLPAFKGIDISGHAEFQALFAMQAIMTAEAVHSLGVPMISNLFNAAMVPIILTDLVWVYETGMYHHSIAEVVTGLGCTTTAILVGELASKTISAISAALV